MTQLILVVLVMTQAMFVSVFLYGLIFERGTAKR